MWKVLCEDFFCHYIKSHDVVLDVGGGHCEFINNILCSRKLVLDINEDTKAFARSEVEVYCQSAIDSWPFLERSVDVVLCSHFFEHLPSKKAVLIVLENARKVLRPNGRLLVLSPNIRYTSKEYWDFFDHYVPLSHVSMEEALKVVGFEVERIIPRFLPYSMKDWYPKFPILIRTYLRLPLLQSLMGKQMFIVAKKP